MRRKTIFIVIIICIVVVSVPAIFWIINNINEGTGDNNHTVSGSYLVNHNHAHREDLKSIPIEWIEEAKKSLNIAYGHTSHGSQLTSGMANRCFYGRE